MATERDEDFIAHIEWEGGIFDALQVGIRSDMVDDPNLKEDWILLEEQWQKIAPIIKRIENHIGRIEEELEE